MRQRLKEDIELIATECPYLKTIHISLFGEKTYLYLNDDDIWQPFADYLTHLRDLTLIGHKWTESEALVRAVGPRLTRIYLALRSLQSWDNTDPWSSSVPKIDHLLDLCPNLIFLTASFGPLTVNVSNNVNFLHLKPQEPGYAKPKMKEITVHTYMTKKAFMYLWSCSPNLEKFKVVNELVIGEDLPHGNDQADFDEDDVSKMFRWNRMAHLSHFEVSIRFKNIVAAKMFIEKLPEKVTKIRTLIIRVALSQDNYPNQEQMLVDIAYVMNRMKQFKEYCSQLKQKSQREVTWAWYRVGVLSEIGNLGFNNFDPDEE